MEKRTVNNEVWASRARKYGSGISATASTAWVRSAMLRRLKKIVTPQSRILEVGCGNASSLLGPLARRCSAYGADLTIEMLRLAKDHHPRIRGFVRSDACHLPFQQASFDVVYTSRCLVNVLDPNMQRLAIKEIFRIVKPSGLVVLIENFEEPVNRMNAARQHYRTGPPVIDEENLRLNLESTIAYCRQLGWRPSRIQGDTLASFAGHVVVPKLLGRRGAQVVEPMLYPFMLLLALFDDAVGLRLPLFGKDVMVIFTSCK